MNQPAPQYGQTPPWQPQGEFPPQNNQQQQQWQPQGEAQAQPPYQGAPANYGAPQQAPPAPYSAPQPAYPQTPAWPAEPQGYQQPYNASPAPAPQYSAPPQAWQASAPQGDQQPNMPPPPAPQYSAPAAAPPQAWQQPPAPYQPAPQPYPQAPAQEPQSYQQPYMPPSAPQFSAPPAAPQPYSQAPVQGPQGYQQPYMPPPAPQYSAPPAAPPQAWQQPPMPYQPQPQAYQQPQQQPYMPPPAQAPFSPQAAAVSFPPPPNLATPRDKLLSGAAPFLEAGEVVYYGFILKLDDAIPETPRELMIEIAGQHHVLGAVSGANRKLNRGLKWALNPMEAASERLAEQTTDALQRKLAGPVFVGGWDSQAGWFIRYARATREDYGPGSWGVLTDRRYLVFRAGRAGGSAMRLVHAVPRTAIAGVRTEGAKNAVLHGRTPRAELHFTDGSMVATMMPTKQGEQVAAILAVQQQPPRY